MNKTKAISLIVVSYLLLTYIGLAPLGSLLIVLLARSTWLENGLEAVGLRIPRAQIRASLLVFCLVAIASFAITATITKSEGIVFVPPWIYGGWAFLFLFLTLGQTLNEEMVLGALSLKSIEGRFKFVNLFVISAGVALIFSLLHLAFYTGALSVITLVSLFFVGVARNNFILSTGNVGYAWAIHLGWNVVVLDASFYRLDSGVYMAESSTFNATLGNTYMLMVTFLLMAVSFLFFVKKRPPRKRIA